MADPPIILTDPARELADLCTALIGGAGNATGDRYLASHFGVPAWSYDFHRIVGAVVSRIEFLKEIVGELDLDSDFKNEMIGHIEIVKSVFGGDSFRNHWSQFGGTRLVAEHIQPLKALSGQVRASVSYKKLTDEEIAAVLALSEELRGWLQEANLREHDFIRGLLIQALADFEFRLRHLRWAGIGYTLDGLRNVISAYLLLERGGIDQNVDPVAQAVLQKVPAFLKNVWGKVQGGREVWDTADWLLRIYGAVAAIQGGTPVITALLSKTS